MIWKEANMTFSFCVQSVRTERVQGKPCLSVCPLHIRNYGELGFGRRVK